MTNFALPHHAIVTEMVNVTLQNVPEPRTAYIERIDEAHANPRRVWEEMGEPTYLSPRDVDQLHAASRLVKEPIGWDYQERTISLDLDVPPQGVAVVTLEYGLNALDGTSGREESH